MEQRKYSLDELDRMRRAISVELWPRGTFRGPVFGYVPEGEQSLAIEDRLRTYMLNGTTPEELEERANAARAAPAG